MDKTNQPILEELKIANKTLSNILIFLLVKEGFGQKEIRPIFGKIDNARITKINSGIKKINAEKLKKDNKKKKHDKK